MMFPSRRFVAGLAFCTIPFALDLGIPGLWRLGWLAVAVLFAVTLLDALFTPRRGAFEVSLRLTPVLTLASEEPIGVEIRNRAGSGGKGVSLLASLTARSTPISRARSAGLRPGL